MNLPVTITVNAPLVAHTVAQATAGLPGGSLIGFLLGLPGGVQLASTLLQLPGSTQVLSLLFSLGA